MPRPSLRRLFSITLILSALGAHAAPADTSGGLRLTDDEGHPVVLTQPARRIVSLAPHLTELLFAAGAGDRVVGVVDYSDHPPQARVLPRVGGYGNLDLEAILALRPDLVVGWASGNREVQLDRLRSLRIPVYLSEPRSLDDVAQALETLGKLAGTRDIARAVAQDFRTRRDRLAARHATQAPVRVFYQIWDQPLMTINGTHLISDVMRLCGGANVFADLDSLAPTISIEAVLAANPEAIIASGMGEERPDWLDAWRKWPMLTATARDHLFFIPPNFIQRHTPRVLEGAEMLCGQLEEVRTARTAKRPAGN